VWFSGRYKQEVQEENSRGKGRVSNARHIDRWLWTWMCRSTSKTSSLIQSTLLLFIFPSPHKLGILGSSIEYLPSKTFPVVEHKRSALVLGTGFPTKNLPPAKGPSFRSFVTASSSYISRRHPSIPSFISKPTSLRTVEPSIREQSRAQAGASDPSTTHILGHSTP
jgi:hypothetical protein